MISVFRFFVVASAVGCCRCQSTRYTLPARTEYEVNQDTDSQEFCARLAAKCPYLRNPKARPVAEERNEKVKLNITFKIDVFLRLGDIDSTFSVLGEFDFTWRLPPCAKWNDSDYITGQNGDGLTVSSAKSCVFSRDSTWHPSIQHLGRIGTDSPFKGGSDVYVSSDGTAFWQVNGQFNSICFMSYVKFPFELQICDVLLSGAYTEDAKSMEVQSASYKASPFGVGDVGFWISESEIWGYVNQTINVTQLADGTFNVLFRITLRRKGEAYYTTIFFPLILLTLTQLGVLLLPAEMSDRSGLAVTGFLASSVLLSLITSKVPDTSEDILLSSFLSVQLAFGVIIVIYALVTCRLCNTGKLGEKLLRTCACSWRIIDVVDFVVLLASACVISAFGVGTVLQIIA